MGVDRMHFRSADVAGFASQLRIQRDGHHDHPASALDLPQLRRHVIGVVIEDEGAVRVWRE